METDIIHVNRVENTIMAKLLHDTVLALRVYAGFTHKRFTSKIYFSIVYVLTVVATQNRYKRNLSEKAWNTLFTVTRSPERRTPARQLPMRNFEKLHHHQHC
jgi:hypothetical protein